MRTWLKNHYVGLSAGVIAFVALAVSMKGCSDINDNNARIAGMRADIDTLDKYQNEIIDVVKDHENRIRENRRDISDLKERIGAVEDSIYVHRSEIDSLKQRADSVEMRVDTIARRQAKCPHINPVPAKNPARPQRPNNLPVRRDTVVVIVKPENVQLPAQNANGCGDDQNANVVVRGNNNTVMISNNGNNGQVVAADTTKNTVREEVIGTCSMRTRVTTCFTWKSR